MITTKKFSFTPKEYFIILLSLFLKKKWWFLLLIIIMALIQLLINAKSGEFLIIFAIAYPLLTFFQLWRYSNSAGNKIQLAERYYEINQTEIIGYLPNISESKINASAFVKVLDVKHTYLLYLSNTKFIYIPKNVFNTTEDRIWFERQFLSHINR